MTEDFVEGLLLGKRVTMAFSDALIEDVTVLRLYPRQWLYVRYHGGGDTRGFVNLHHVQRIVFVPNKPPIPEILEPGRQAEEN